MIATSAKTPLDFLAGTGEMGGRIRGFDWSRTPLGPIETWPHALKTSVSLILGSRHPMWVGWGREMTFLYNDAYLQVLGPAKHPSALGLPACEVWTEIWDVCGPLADKVFENGEATFVDDVRLFMNRGDFLEETFYSFSYSPIRDDSGEVCGLFCPSTDVTQKVLSTRRLSTLAELAANPILEKTTAAACAKVAGTLSKNPDDVPFALLYLIDAAGGHASLEQAVGNFASGFAASTTIDLDAASTWAVGDVFRDGRRRKITVRDITGLPGGVAGKQVIEAVALPVASHGEQKPYGVLVAGMNPCRPLDAEYATFFELAASQVATAIQNAKAIEEQTKRADELAAIDRAKTLFFSNVSHEFRTPLTLMLGPLENLLAKRDDLRPEEREQVAIAHRNSLRLLKLVNSLLDFSRLEAGRLKATFIETDLARFTRDLASNFRSAIEAAGLELIVDCPAQVEPAWVDREMWEKIVLNLLSNAFKFTFEGSVKIELRAAGGEAVLSVADTGIGIPQHELPRVFERFHRVEGARGRTYEGSGIGLALIQEYVKLHGGHVDVESRVGEGSTFRVTVPMGDARLSGVQASLAFAGAERRDASLSTNSGQTSSVLTGSAISQGATGSGSSSTPGTTEAFANEMESWLDSPRKTEEPAARSATIARIVLADDNHDMREHIRRVLGRQYQIVTAKDGAEALELIRKERPDLVLSDVMMPRMNGFELLFAIRADERTHTLPVIFLSARAGDELRVEGLEAGADDYLVKPFTASELRARVGTHVKMALARRRASEREASLRAEAEAVRDQLIAVLESITDSFVALDRDWRILSVNAQSERLRGFSRNQMIGRNMWDLFPGVRSEAHNELDRAMRERRAVEFEYRYEPMGRWFHVKAYPASDDGLSIFSEDITERKRAEEELLRSEQRFRELADAMPQIVWTARPDGSIDYYNQQWYDFSGIRRGQVDDESWSPFLHPDDWQASVDAWQTAVATGEPFRIQCRLRDRHENRWRWFLCRCRPVRDEQARIVKWFGTTTDIDEQKRVEDELRRANQDLEQFAYSASHDLQEPLRSVKIYGELLAKRYSAKLDGQALEFLEFLRMGATRMETLVRDLLAYTQIGKLDAPSETIDTNECLAATLEGLAGAVRESGACITADPLPAARVHRAHLQQLFQNLIANAIKYRSPERACAVHIAGTTENGSRLFSIADNGIGIAPEYKEHIFGLFKRLHTSDEYSGTGIGLAICQRIVERYHGRIWVESAPGRGSTFFFAVPD